ncbi:MAG: asparagine synthase (glutamine-hydrolyzing) [Candidatus Aenigmarchaeota archaeon]|nr:asparagine synthase (glutamine-hydrolyzing) [Candidatus Aenigmarchaeota archaeon]
MCGISGFNWCDKILVKNMNKSIKHRGPDGDGFFLDDNISLGHVRLSILDLSEKGKQPMKDEEGELIVTFNGEIYNFEEIKKILEKKGYSFNSGTDTEVIIYAYKEWGTKCVEKFNGMWAFCLYDSAKKKLFLSRDRMGKKPIYYYIDEDKFIFCSEIKGILKHPVKRKLNRNQLATYLTYHFTPGEDTLIKKIKKVPASHNMIFDLKTKKLKLEKYWDIEKDDIKYENFEEAKDKLDELLNDAVKKRIISDVPVGSFLSGGLDSSIVTAIYSKYYDKEMHTFSVGFDEGIENEFKYAKIVADELGTNHHEFIVDGDMFSKRFDEMVLHYDDPLAEAGFIPNYFLSQYAKKYVSVALAGEGGDEVFAGYEWYGLLRYTNMMSKFPFNYFKPIFCDLAKIIPPSRMLKGVELLANAGNYAKSNCINLSFFSQNEIKNLMTYNVDYNKVVEAANTHIKNFSYPLNQLQYIDQKVLLTECFNMKADKATLAFGLEERCPLQDYRLVEFSYQLPTNFKLNGGKEKYILKEVGKKYLPLEIVNRKKRGYNVPYDYWINKFMKSEVVDTLDNSLLVKNKLINKNIVDLYLKNMDKNRHYCKRSFGLFVLEKYLDAYGVEVKV